MSASIYRSPRLRRAAVLAWSTVAAAFALGGPASAQSLDFSNGFWFNTGLSGGGSAVRSGNVARLTRGNFGDQGIVYTQSKLNVTSFRTSFTFQFLPGIGSGHSIMADGITFTIQNSGPMASWGGGGGLAVGPDSIRWAPAPLKNVSIKFDNYNNEGEGPSSTGLYKLGVAPTIPATDTRPKGIDFHSYHVFQVDMAYQSNVLTVTIRDTATGAAMTSSYNIDIPATIGGNTAWVGFTGTTGGLTARQSVLTWEWNRVPTRIVRVSGSAGNDANDGSSWGAPVKTIQRGIDLAGFGGDVWIAGGTYYERPYVRAGVSLFGGFAGVETLRDQRNWNTNATIIDAGGAFGATWIDPGKPPRLDGLVIRNSRRAVVSDGACPYLVNCLIEGNKDEWGPGLTGSTTSPLVVNCSFRNNISTGDGGSMLYVWDCSPYVTQTVFTGNRASATRRGGAFLLWQTLDPVFASNTFTGNSAGMGGGAGHINNWYDSLGRPNGSAVFVGNVVENNVAPQGGTGGVEIFSTTDLVATDNRFSGNDGVWAGGFSSVSSPGFPATFSRNRVHWNNGDFRGGLFFQSVRVVFNGNEVVGNSGEAPGGVGFWATSGQIHDNYFGWNNGGWTGAVLSASGNSAEIHHNTFDSNWSDQVSGALEVNSSNPAVHNNLFRNNSAAQIGGAIGIGAASPRIVNNTFVGNGWMAINSWISNPLIANNIIAFNNGGISRYGGNPILKNNDVYANSTDYLGIGPGAGDISEDPKFVNPAGWDYSLQPLSCLIDRGDDASAIGPYDYWYWWRFMGNHVDIGMRESPYTRETIAPVTVATVSPAAVNGWVAGPATVTLTATDTGGSGVRRITYSATGANPIGETTVNGSTTTITLSATGETSVTFFAEDNVCNEEAPKTVTVKVDSTKPTLTASADAGALWPPNGKMVAVPVTGLLSDTGSGIASEISYTVVDEYGEVQPSGTASVAADGSFAFPVMLEARRDGQDRDGRTYTIYITGKDRAGNTVTVVVEAVVPHDQRP